MNNIPNIKDFVGGWFIGDFEPTLLKTSQFEVSVKKYFSGEREKAHVHKIATEFTVIIQGSVEMNSKRYNEGDIVIIKPNESTDFEAITDVITLVVKTPSVLGDKFLIN